MTTKSIEYGGASYEVLPDSSGQLSVFREGVYVGSIQPVISINNQMKYHISNTRGELLATYQSDDETLSPDNYAIEVLHEHGRRDDE